MLLPIICLFIAGTLLACEGDISKSEKKRKAVEAMEAMKANLRESSERAAAINAEAARKKEAAINEEAARKKEAAINEAARKEEAARNVEEARIQAKLNDPALKIYSRLEFRYRVLSLNQSQVLAAVGKPTSTSDSTSSQVWFYSKRTRDPIADKVDSSAIVFFKFGVVQEVNFN